MHSGVEDSGGGEEDPYRNLMLMCSSVGIISSVVFHVIVKDTAKFDLEVFRIILRFYRIFIKTSYPKARITVSCISLRRLTLTQVTLMCLKDIHLSS